MMAMRQSADRTCDRLTGVLLGTAVGDALGLPMENLSPEKIRRWFPGPMRMRLVFGRGMISDDTEHTLMVAQALLMHPNDPAAFQRCLGWKLRWWFAGLPGGVGLATARACIRLWVGFPASKSGVVSAGGGPAMRSAIIGAFFANDSEKRRAFVLASSRLTHRSWQAETAAIAVAEAAAMGAASGGNPAAGQVLESLRTLSNEAEWQNRLSQLESSLNARDSVAEFARKLGLERGVTGYSLHVVLVALYAWLRHPGEFAHALSSAIACGGDTDTVGAITGAFCGCTTGPTGIPAEWLDNLWEWPRSRKYMEGLGIKLAVQQTSNTPLGPLSYFWPAQIPRNLIFLAIVLAHGFGRIRFVFPAPRQGKNET